MDERQGRRGDMMYECNKAGTTLRFRQTLAEWRIRVVGGGV